MKRGISMAVVAVQAACVLPNVSPVEEGLAGVASDKNAESSTHVDQNGATPDLRTGIATVDAAGMNSAAPQSSGAAGSGVAEAQEAMGTAGASGSMASGSDAANSQPPAMNTKTGNPCHSNNGGCSLAPMAQCAAAQSGERTCTCPSGYSGSGIGPSGCVDVDECEFDNGVAALRQWPNAPINAA